MSAEEAREQRWSITSETLAETIELNRKSAYAAGVREGIRLARAAVAEQMTVSEYAKFAAAIDALEAGA
jgi:hypothetical protein